MATWTQLTRVGPAEEKIYVNIEHVAHMQRPADHTVMTFAVPCRDIIYDLLVVETPDAILQGNFYKARRD